MKPEAGKFYRTRNGQKAGPMKYVRRAFPFEGLVDGGLESWSESGSYRLGVSDHPLDLVAEWTIHDDANVKFDAEKNDSIDAPMEMYDVTLDADELKPEPASLDGLLSDRKATHGEYIDHASFTQQIKTICHGSKNWQQMNCHQRETLDMVAHKIGRILAGDPHFDDHWRDISGYAKLTADRL